MESNHSENPIDFVEFRKFSDDSEILFFLNKYALVILKKSKFNNNEITKSDVDTKYQFSEFMTLNSDSIIQIDHIVSKNSYKYLSRFNETPYYVYIDLFNLNVLRISGRIIPQLKKVGVSCLNLIHSNLGDFLVDPVAGKFELNIVNSQILSNFKIKSSDLMTINISDSTIENLSSHSFSLTAKSSTIFSLILNTSKADFENSFLNYLIVFNIDDTILSFANTIFNTNNNIYLGWVFNGPIWSISTLLNGGMRFPYKDTSFRFKNKDFPTLTPSLTNQYINTYITLSKYASLEASLPEIEKLYNFFLSRKSIIKRILFWFNGAHYRIFPPFLLLIICAISISLLIDSSGIQLEDSSISYLYNLPKFLTDFVFLDFQIDFKALNFQYISWRKTLALVLEGFFLYSLYSLFNGIKKNFGYRKIR